METAVPRRPFVEFLKTTAVGGLLVIVPVAIVLYVVAQLVLALHGAVSQVVDATGIATGRAYVGLALSILAFVALCFVTGLLVRTRAGRWLKRWFARRVGARLPMFRALSNLTRAFIGVDRKQFSPVEVDLHGTGVMSLGFLVENLPDGRRIVFVPSAPMATLGSVFVVPAERITALNASLAETVGVVTQWGLEAGTLYRPPEQAPADQAARD